MPLHTHHIAGFQEEQKLVRSATWAALLAAIFFVLIKAYAWWSTGSLAMFAVFLDALLDTLSSLAIFFAVRFAQTPADAEHRFGHGKAESLASLFVGGVMAASMLFLAMRAVEGLLNPQPFSQPLIGIAAVSLVIFITLLLILYQAYVVRKTGSLAIKADSLHYRADFLLHISVILSLAVTQWLDAPILDPLFALAVAIYIAYQSLDIVQSAVDQLLDRELSDEERAAIKDAAEKHQSVSKIHDLRTRRAGQNVFIQMHIELPSNISLMEAHRISDEVEDAVQKLMPNAEVLIHQDPEGLEKTTTLERS